MHELQNYLPLWGQWNIEELIGEGQDSRVYRVVCSTPDGQKYAAVKHFSVAPTEDPAQSERKARGLLALADRQIALRGKPHLAEYYERQAYRRADGGYDVFVRMELLTSLRSVMGKTEFSEAMLAQLGQEASEALLALEEAGTCHGALHPANIFLSRAGTYKLGDYCRSRVGMTSGSAREYLAPEVLTGGSLPSANSDRYSLGMVLYRLSNALRGPFLPQAPAPISREDRQLADRRRVRGDSLPIPVNAGSRLAFILQQACAFAPQKRYSSTDAMLHDFLMLQNPEAELMPPAAPTEPVQTPPPQRKPKKKASAFAVGAILAVVILLAGGITAAVLVRAQQAKHPKKEEAAQTQLRTPVSEPTAPTQTQAVTKAVTTEVTEEETTLPPETEQPTTEEATVETTAPPTTAAAEPYKFSLSSTYNYVDFTIPASGYVIADSDTRYITTADLEGMTKNQVRMACNEIFARKGRIFQSKTMRDYFSAMPWYHGTVDGGYFDSHQSEYLTAVELANARTIVQYERSKGWN